MADCGASGTALDQATRAFLGASSGGGGATVANGHAQKQLGSLLGHAALASSHQTTNNNGGGMMMPLSRPDHIALPDGRGGAKDLLLSVGAQQQQQQQHLFGRQLYEQQHHNAASPLWQGPNHFPMQQQPIHHGNHHNFLAMQQQQQQQQHHQMIMQQQQHQMQLMQHQHQHLLQQQQQQQKLQQAMKLKQKEQSKQEITDPQSLAEQETTTYTDEGNVKGVTIEELAAAWAESEADTSTTLEPSFIEEGNIQGATMEELAAAWADAQDQYYEQQSAEEDVVDPSDYFYNNSDINQQAKYTFVNEVAKVGTAANTTTNTNIPPDTTDFMQEGMKQFENGNIAEAIKNFEMELQLNDPDNATAWRMLGRCHAENDQDREAIVCLETAVERDPFSPEAQLALGVSYVNELNHAKALQALKSWITMNPKYAGMDVDIGGEEDVYGDSGGRIRSSNDADFQELQRLLLKALEHDDSDAADVWEALGVAANVSRDFETAVEAFQKAIEARPDDYQLWNKLGATLANGNQSAKALPAYHKALQLKPKYARAWLNMAISHSNLQDFDEAARCYLQTLSLNPAAVHCWSYLRVALSCSERWDLIPFAASQNLDAFREHFDFVMYDKSS